MRPTQAGLPLIGRERALQSVRDAQAEALTDSARVVLVGGEAGIGKTRLIDEFVAEASTDAIVARGQCVDFASDAPPYGPLAAVLRQLLTALGADRVRASAGPAHDALRVLLPELAGAPEDTQLDDDAPGGRGRLFEAITALVESVASHQPLLVVIEDLHWCDQATLSVLRFLVKVVDARGLLLIFTFRSDELGHGHPLRSWLPELDRSRRVVRIDLARLNRAQVGRMLAAAWGEPASRADIDAVYTRSDGIPFFVEELASDGPGAALSMSMPKTLRGVLLARYETLSEDAQNVLRAIAAGGQHVRHDLLVRVMAADDGDIDTAAREAISADVLVADDTSYTFRHALMQEAVHSQLLPGERVRLHTAYAEALTDAGRTGMTDAGAISYHWMAAHNLRNAFAASIEAMRQARASYANSAAARMGERAIELWDRVPDAQTVAGRSRVDLLSETAYVLRNAGESERALALIDEALDADDGADPELRAAMLRNKASFLANDGRTGSIELLGQARDLLTGTQPSVLRANVLGELAARLMLAGRLVDAVSMADRAYTEAVAVHSDTRRSVAVNIRGVSRVSLGEIDEGLADLAQARELAGETMDSAYLRYWVNQSHVLAVLGRFADAVAMAEEGVAIARERGVERTSGAILVANMIAPLFALGQADRATELLDNALELDAPIGYSAPLQRDKLWMTLIAGDPMAADRLLHSWRAGLDRQRQIDAPADLNLAYIDASIAMELGDPVRAWHAASALVRAGRDRDPAFDLPLAAIGARALARLTADRTPIPATDAIAEPLTYDAARNTLREVVDAVSWWPAAPGYVAIFAAELGGADARGDDPELWKAAIVAAEHPTSPAHLWPYAAYRSALVSAAAGDRAAAESSARAARDRAAQIGAGLYVRHADDFLNRAGLTARPTSSDTSSESGRLTDRESQVLDLLAQGLSNREIGERLFISTKTASVHVSNILRKTGASSRTEAAYLSRPRD
jgi:ATP/maltotriose-dependent transcriptional regulator MalT